MDNFISVDEAAQMVSWRWAKKTFRKYVYNNRLNLRKVRAHGKIVLCVSEVEQLAKGGTL